MKQALNRFGDLTEGSLECAQTDVRLEPEWRKTLAGSSNKKGYASWGTTGKIKKKLNPLGTDGRVLLCSSCGSYRQFVAECPDSMETMKKMRASEDDTKCGDRGNRNNITGKELRAGIMTELVDRSYGEKVAQIVCSMEDYSINISVKNSNISSETVETVNFHFSHYKSMGNISCHSNQSSYPTEIKNTTFVEANILSMYVKFQLQSPHGF